VLLITFHGGASPGINNIFAYATPACSLLTPTALANAKGITLSELRAMVLADGQLYVANGAKSQSQVLCYTPPASGSTFTYKSTVIGPTTNKGIFETSIAHPFGIAFNGQWTCYVSNQDTNVVAQVALSSKGHTATMGSGCQSAWLNNLYPKPDVFLDGTYVASHVGTLQNVGVNATAVHTKDGGLGVGLDKSNKVQNSVRDVAIANGILFVCNEPDSVVNLYSLADGAFLGASNVLAEKPTHFTIQNGGLYVSAGTTLYWGPLPTTVSGALSSPLLSLAPVTLTPLAPTGNKIGGISFANDATPVTVYVPFQPATSGANGGSIFNYTVSQSTPSAVPALVGGTQFVASGTDTFADTPEFVLYVAG
jgi:hypothetical protein